MPYADKVAFQAAWPELIHSDEAALLQALIDASREIDHYLARAGWTLPLAVLPWLETVIIDLAVFGLTPTAGGRSDAMTSLR